MNGDKLGAQEYYQFLLELHGGSDRANDMMLAAGLWPWTMRFDSASFPVVGK